MKLAYAGWLLKDNNFSLPIKRSWCKLAFWM